MAHELEVEKPQSLTKRKWFVPVLILVLIVAGLTSYVILLAAFTYVLKSADIYQQTMDLIQQDDQIISVLGLPIEDGFWVTGEMRFDGSRGDAYLTIPVSGSRDSGTLYVVAEKDHGQWTYETLALVLFSSHDVINVLPSYETALPVDPCNNGDPPNEQRLLFITERTKDVFEPIKWQRIDTEKSLIAQSAWLQDGGNAVVLREYASTTCRTVETEVKDYFEEEILKGTVLRSNENLSTRYVCWDTYGSLVLKEYVVKANDENYSLRYWTQPDYNQNIVITIMVFPVQKELELNNFASILYPELVSCQR